MSFCNYSEEPYVSIRKACETDDAAFLSCLITPELVATNPVQDQTLTLLEFACDTSISHNAISTLSYIVSDCKFNVRNVQPGRLTGAKKVSTKILDILLAHGWDINTHSLSTRQKRMPFLWYVLSDAHLVSYCLSHGADVYPKGQPPIDPDVITPELLRCPPLLESAAVYSSVSTFDLLRLHKAPIGWRALHLAVGQATVSSLAGQPDSTGELLRNEEYDKSWTYAERMAMVRHLVEDVGLDVNAFDQPMNQKHLPNFHCGTPLCYISMADCIHLFRRARVTVANTRELTWYLLDHGADPTQALEMVKFNEHPTFAADVEAWQAQKKHVRSSTQSARFSDQ